MARPPLALPGGWPSLLPPPPGIVSRSTFGPFWVPCVSRRSFVSIPAPVIVFCLPPLGTVISELALAPHSSQHTDCLWSLRRLVAFGSPRHVLALVFGGLAAMSTACSFEGLPQPRSLFSFRPAGAGFYGKRIICFPPSITCILNVVK
jgi:hypothetical protein